MRRIAPIRRPAVIAILLCALAPFASANPVDNNRAQAAVSGWLRKTGAARTTANVGEVKTHTAADGSPVFYVVPLHDQTNSPDGFAIAAPDDEAEPIIAFSTRGTFADLPQNPAVDILEKDLAIRLKAIKAAKALNQNVGIRLNHQQKWNKLIGQNNLPMAMRAVGAMAAAPAVADASPATSVSEAAIDDMVVPPLIQSQWNQQGEWSTQADNWIPFYSYYTPPSIPGVISSPGSTKIDYCGCVATAWAQIMRYWQWPRQPGVGTQSFQCTIAYTTTTNTVMLPLRGGDGNGGPYDWADMPLLPYDTPITLAQQQAVGALCYDAGVAMGMNYAPGGSGANLHAYIIDSVFQYANSAEYINWASDTDPYDEPTARAIRTSLDAGLPVGLGINDHEIDCDGYGYSQGTLYHHINLGWGATGDQGDNFWYEFPIIDPPVTGNTFDSPFISMVNFNIDPYVKGELVTGRITYNDGTPAAGAIATLQSGAGAAAGQILATATASQTGIYSFKGLKSLTGYTVAAYADPGVQFPNNPRAVATGTSPDNAGAVYSMWLDNSGQLVGDQIADFTQLTGTASVEIEQAGTILQNGKDDINLGNAGTSGTQTSQSSFTIDDGGQGTLDNLAITISGDNDFTVTESFTSQTALRTGQTTTFVVTFTPKAPGVRTATLTVSSNDPVNPAFTINLTGTGCILPTVSNLTYLDATAGAAFFPHIMGSNATSYLATNLPPGMSLDAVTAVLSGTPTAAGTYYATITATNPYGSAVEALTIAVNNPPPPTFAGAPSPMCAVIGYPLTEPINASSCSTYSALGLPGGVSIGPATGLISGAPVASGTFNATITASNGYSSSQETASITVTPLPALPCPILDELTGKGFSYQLPTYIAITGSDYPVTYSAANLPAGLSLDTLTGIVSGTICTGGTYSGSVTLSTRYSSQTLSISAMVSSPTYALGGNYFGLITGTGSLIGNATFTLNPQGAFSGKVISNKKHYALAGVLDAYGRWTGKVRSANKKAQFAASLSLVESGSAWQLSGSIATSAATAFSASQSLSPAALATLPAMQGNYTASLLSGTDQTVTATNTNGAGKATIAKNAMLTVILKLNDGKRTSCSMPLTQSLSCPIYTTKAGQRIFGTLQFETRQSSVADGAMTWTQTASRARPASTTPAELLLSR